MQTPGIFTKYNWQIGLTGHASLDTLGTFHEAVQLEQILATGRTAVYFVTAKGVLFSSWEKPK